MNVVNGAHRIEQCRLVDGDVRAADGGEQRFDDLQLDLIVCVDALKRVGNNAEQTIHLGAVRVLVIGAQFQPQEMAMSKQL